MTRVFFLFECPAYEQIGMMLKRQPFSDSAGEVMLLFLVFPSGAADFLPDYLPNEMHGRSPSSPKYSDFYSILVKVNQWLEKVRVCIRLCLCPLNFSSCTYIFIKIFFHLPQEVRIVNIQTMEALFPGPAQAGETLSMANPHFYTSFPKLTSLF